MYESEILELWMAVAFWSKLLHFRWSLALKTWRDHFLWGHHMKAPHRIPFWWWEPLTSSMPFDIFRRHSMSLEFPWLPLLRPRRCRCGSSRGPRPHGDLVTLVTLGKEQRGKLPRTMSHEMNMRWKRRINNDQQRYKLENTAQTWSIVKFWQYKAAIDQLFPALSAPRLEYLWDSPTGQTWGIRLSGWASVNVVLCSCQERQWRSTGVKDFYADMQNHAKSCKLFECSNVQEIFMEYDRDRSGVAGLSMAQLLWFEAVAQSHYNVEINSPVLAPVPQILVEFGDITRLWKSKSFAPC